MAGQIGSPTDEASTVDAGGRLEMHRYGLLFNARSATKFRFAVRLPQLLAEARNYIKRKFFRSSKSDWMAECLPEQFGPSFSDLALGENRKCRVKLSKDLVRIIDFQILHQPNSPRDESSWPFRANVLRSTAGSRRAP